MFRSMIRLFVLAACIALCVFGTVNPALAQDSNSADNKNIVVATEQTSQPEALNAAALFKSMQDNSLYVYGAFSALLVILLFALWIIWDRSRTYQRSLENGTYVFRDVFDDESISFVQGLTNVRTLNDFAMSAADELELLENEHGQSSNLTAGSVIRQPENYLFRTLSKSVDETLDAIDGLLETPEFRALNQTCNIQKTYLLLQSLLHSFGNNAQANHLVNALRDDKLNAVLPMVSFLEAYYADLSSDWHHLQTQANLVDSLIQALLNKEGIRLKIIRPLTNVSLETQGVSAHDTRSLKLLAPVRSRAGIAFKQLRDDEYLVVECISPGWVSDHRGSREPNLTIYDPASWTKSQIM